MHGFRSAVLVARPSKLTYNTIISLPESGLLFDRPLWPIIYFPRGTIGICTVPLLSNTCCLHGFTLHSLVSEYKKLLESTSSRWLRSKRIATANCPHRGCGSSSICLVYSYRHKPIANRKGSRYFRIGPLRYLSVALDPVNVLNVDASLSIVVEATCLLQKKIAGPFL